VPVLATNPALSVVVFVAGVVLAVWSTERLVDGLVGLSRAARLPPFAVGALLSGFEAENIAVGIAAGAAGAAEVAMGTVFGGATFLVCVALGVGGVLYPLEVRLPRGALIALAAAPVVAGLALIPDADQKTPRLAGVALLVVFVAAMGYLVSASRGHRFVDSDEVEEALEHHRSGLSALGLTVFGLLVIGIGGDMVATGASGIVATLGVPAALMGMVVAPAAVELEEIVRQSVPTRKGHPEVSAGNLVGTLLYFVLFNLGLIVLITPVTLTPSMRALDWPALVAVTWLATWFLARGRVGRPEGAVLLVAYAAYAVAHLLV
jgi:cation:H+ antiporter